MQHAKLFINIQALNKAENNGIDNRNKSIIIAMRSTITVKWSVEHKDQK